MHIRYILYIHYKNIRYTLHNHYIYTTFALHIHYISNAYPFYIHFIFNPYPLHIHFKPYKYALHIHNLFIRYTFQKHYISLCHIWPLWVALLYLRRSVPKSSIFISSARTPWNWILHENLVYVELTHIFFAIHYES